MKTFLFKLKSLQCILYLLFFVIKFNYFYLFFQACFKFLIVLDPRFLRYDLLFSCRETFFG